MFVLAVAAHAPLLHASAPQLGATPLPRAVAPHCAIDGAPPPPSAALVALAAAPVALAVGSSQPLAAAVYLPLLAVGYAAEANPAAAVVLSTLLYVAGAGLGDAPPAATPLVLLVSSNCAVALLMVRLELDEPALPSPPPRAEDALASFDRRLEAAARARAWRGRGGWPRMNEEAAAPRDGDQDSAPRDGGEDSAPRAANADRSRNGAYDFSPMADAFEGQRVLDMRARQREREKSRASPATVVSNLMAQGPGTAVLVVLFAILTVGDIIFNISRLFICALPELCEAAPIDVISPP